MDMTLSQKIKTLMRVVIDMQQKELAAELSVSPPKMTRILSEKYNFDQDEGWAYLQQIASIFSERSEGDVNAKQLFDLPYAELVEILEGKENRPALAFFFSRNTLLLVGILTGLGLILSLLQFWPESNPPQWPPTGKITSPGMLGEVDTVYSTILCQGTLTPLKPGYHAWLVTEVFHPDSGTMYWPKKTPRAISPDEDGFWEAEVFEDGVQRNIKLALFVFPDSVNHRINEWLRRCAIKEKYPSFPNVDNSWRLTRVDLYVRKQYDED